MSEKEDQNHPKNLAMQTTCIHCLSEQYAPAVYEISMGRGECAWCGKPSRIMTIDEYQKTILHEIIHKQD